MTTRWARTWFAATFACALAGIVISVITAVDNQAGQFHPGAARALNVFVLFTTDSNVLVAVTALLLAISLQRRTRGFAVLELTSLTAIVVTAIVYNTVLRDVGALTTNLANLGNELVHVVVPVMMVLGWLVVGPRGLITPRTVGLSLGFPLAWLVFTLIRGAIAHWYPYSFVNAMTLGYPTALINCLLVALMLLGLAVAAGVVDRVIRRRTGRRSANV